MKIISVLGARPQFIKSVILNDLLSKRSDIDNIIIHTGQHFDKNMSLIFFDELLIKKPKYNLNINSLSHGAMTGRQLEQIEKIFLQELPDLVIVYGDTNTTLAGALAASKLNIPLAHIESGLRSFNLSMPEEVNRILTDRISSYLFTPSKIASDNLIKENIEKNIIYQVGDIMYDILLYFKEKSLLSEKILKENNIFPNSYTLLTLHRQENTNNKRRISQIFNAIEVSNDFFIFPIHPGTKKILKNYKISMPKNVIVMKPVGYLDMLTLINNSKKIMTDSGGLQKEAYYMGKPCIVLRNETEWTELVEHGASILVDDDFDNILDALKNHEFKNINKNIYGDGTASNKIIEILLK